MSLQPNLLGGPPPTFLPEDPAAAALADGVDAALVTRANPTRSLAWADGQVLQSYAFARVGYHRGLDSLRRNGWKGHGPVPWSHEPNRGFLRCLGSLRRAADAIGEADEVARLDDFLTDCDPAAPRP